MKLAVPLALAAWALAAPHALAAPPDTAARAPAAVDTAQAGITAWLTGLKGLSVDEVKEKLGTPREESTWQIGGKAAPKLTYTTSEGGDLLLYFHEGTVITASLQLMSK